MPDSREPDHPVKQQELFTQIALRYDLANHLMTGWRDNAWRRYAAKQLLPFPSARLLDIGCGNGQLIQEIIKQNPDTQPIAADLTQAMLEVGQAMDKTGKINWVRTNSNLLPFEEDLFDGVISGFLVRNLSNLTRGLREQYRVLKPGGRIAILETCRPPQHLLSPLIKLYMNILMPVLGGIVTGKKEAYTYLNRSTTGFLRAEELVAYLAAVGFKKIAYKKFALGAVSVHWGEK
jgi:demethylmenaquinone methyltransferase/2-methoxy-6-polyprenyl-1,4-benzoquinol methylase